MLEATNITLVKNIYAPNEKIVVSYEGMSGDKKDWIALYHKESSNEWKNVIESTFTAGKVKGTHTFSPLKNGGGEYEVRAFFHNSYQLEAKATFSLGKPNNQDQHSTLTTTSSISTTPPTLKIQTNNKMPTDYGKMGNFAVELTPYSKDARAVIYHPTSWTKKSTPVIFFGPGKDSTQHMSYYALLKFVASHGYSVIYMPDIGSYPSQLRKFDDIIKEFSTKLDTTKVGMMGHSLGGAMVYPLMQHIMAKGYGARKNGVNHRFMFSMDGFFAQNMDKKDVEALSDFNIISLQFGRHGNSTDPRILLVNYQLLSGKNIDKNYIVLEDTHHSYPQRDNITKMQEMLKPLDALMKYTFTSSNAKHHKVALEGEGKINPYTSGYQKVLAIDKYPYNCKNSKKWHKGADKNTMSDINYCGNPEMKEN